jgi:transposase
VPLTFDAGFDSEDNRERIRDALLKPVIHPNRRNTKSGIVWARKFRWFDRMAYRQRFTVERTFGWQDTCRKLVVSFDRLLEVRKGSRLLAYAMINYRATFNHSRNDSL